MEALRVSGARRDRWGCTHRTPMWIEAGVAELIVWKDVDESKRMRFRVSIMRFRGHV